jgi:perosamine synthetase
MTPSKGRPLRHGRLAVALRRRSPFRDRWRSIRLRDFVALARYGVRGVSTTRKGRAIEQFERSFAQSVGSPYALIMNSGTAAIHSAYFAAGIGPGDEVIVPSYTFFASVAPMLPLGGVPVFCEIDPATLTADPDDVERRITARTRAICVVHLWGNPARLDRFTDVARRHNLALIEDCSHAHGALYQDRHVGTWGDIGCFSLQGSKPVSGGEAGIAVTADPGLHDRMLALGHFPRPLTDQQAGTFDIGELSLGFKYRAHLYAATLALGGLKRLDELNELRRQNYEIIGAELSGSRVLETIPETPDAVRGGFYRFALRYHAQHAGGWDRHSFVKAANLRGIPIGVDPYPPLHQEPLFAKRLWAEPDVFGRLHGSEAPEPPPTLPVTERTWSELITLAPLTKLSEGSVRRCARILREIASSASRRSMHQPDSPMQENGPVRTHP